MKMKIEPKSLALGLLMGAILVVSVAAAIGPLFIKEIFPIRFRVLEASSPNVDWDHGGKVVVLKLTPWHGKISKDSQEWRQNHETQEFSIVTVVDYGYAIQKDDIIGLRAYQHLK